MMSVKPFVSIIIPTYKPTGYLYECLQSIANQSFTNFELLLVLNGCYEPYKSQIEEWIQLLKIQERTVLIHTSRGGVSNARNIGLEKAMGQFITFIDDDDLISPDYLAELVNNISGKNSIVVSNIKLLSNGSKEEISYGPEKAFTSIRKQGFKNMFKSRKLFNGPWMKLFPRELINKHRFDTNISLGEDALFCFTISRYIKDIRSTSASANYIYRLRDGGVSWANKSRKEFLFHLRYLVLAYCKVYFSSPLKYNFWFFISRIVATIHSFGHRIFIEN